VGLLYSGGIDSNIISSVIEEKIPRFTGGMHGDSDLIFAASMQKEGYNVHLVDINQIQFKQRLKQMVELRGEPLSVPNEVVLSFLGEAWAKSGGKVLLSGEGADEFFGGYDRVFRWAANIKDFNLEEFLAYYSYGNKSEIPEWLLSKLKEFFNRLEDLCPFEKVRYFFIKKHLPTLFRRLDFALMFAGIEGREPLATYDLLQLALRFSPNSLVNQEVGKIPLRIFAERRFGAEFAFAKKVGFPIDLVKIYSGRPARDRFENYDFWHRENIRILG